MENELVRSYRNEILTNSMIIAEKFGKSHKNVLQKIDNLQKNLSIIMAEKSVTKKNKEIEVFRERTRTVRGREFRYVEMNKPAFTLLVMGFTGKKALEWRRTFNAAFYQMEHILLNNANLEWKQNREQGKQIRLGLTDTIKDFVDYATNQGSKSAFRYYSNITKMTYKALRLIEKNEKVSKDFRNTLEIMDLHMLLSAEMTARKALAESMKKGLHYKDCYQVAKQKVMQLADLMIMTPKLKE